MEQINVWDRDLFLWLNSQGHPYLDDFMLFLSAKWVWIPLYLLLIYLLYREYGSQFWKPLMIVLLCVLFADQITSAVMKPFFERLRPCKDPQIMDLVSVVGSCGGKYGFASSHAANTVALSVFFLGLFRKKIYWILVGWALMVSYSRIYLGVHYPGDVLVGGLIGGLFGYTGAHISRNWLRESVTIH